MYIYIYIYVCIHTQRTIFEKNGKIHRRSVSCWRTFSSKLPKFWPRSSKPDRTKLRTGRALAHTVAHRHFLRSALIIVAVLVHLTAAAKAFDGWESDFSEMECDHCDHAKEPKFAAIPKLQATELAQPVPQ